MADELTRSEYLSALLNKKNSYVAQGGNLLNPALSNDTSGLAELDTSFNNGLQTNTDVIEKSNEKVDNRSDFEKFLGNVTGFIDELAAKFGAGFVNGWEGILDLGATAIGALGDATGWYEGSTFTDWAKQDIGGNLAEWTKTYANLTPWGIANAIKNTQENGAQYWQDAFNGAVDIGGSGLFMQNQINNYREDSDKYYRGRDELTTPVGQFVGGVAQSIGNMLPAIMTAGSTGLSGMAAKGLTTGLMGLSAAGQGSEQALNEGASSAKALAYGAASGAVEAATEWVFPDGGVGGVRVGQKFLTSGLKKEIVKEMAQEGLEEVMSGLAEPALKAIYQGDKAFEEYKNPEKFLFGIGGDFNESVLGQFASGAVTGGLMSGISSYTQNKNIKAKYGEGVNAVMAYADMMENASKALKYEQGSKQYNEYSKAALDNYSEFVEEWSKIKNTISESDLKKLRNALSNPADFIKDAKSISDAEFIENKLSNFNTLDKIETNATIENIASRAVQNGWTFEFADDIDANGLIDRKNKVVKINSKLEGEYGSILAHEYVGHYITEGFGGVEEISKIAKQVFNTEWYKSKETALKYQYQKKDDIYKDFIKRGDKTGAENYFESEVVANYIQNVVKGKGGNYQQLSFLNKLFEKQSFFKKLISKFSKAKAQTYDTVMADVKNVVDAYLKSSKNKAIKGVYKQIAAGKKYNELNAEDKVVYNANKGFFDVAENILSNKTEEPAVAYSKKIVDGRIVKKSILNQEGGKYNDAEKLMPVIWSIKGVDRFIDVFGGTGVVAMNAGFDNAILNDSNSTLTSIYKEIANNKPTDIKNYIYKTIDEYKLRTREGYSDFIKHYNSLSESARNPIDLLILQKFSRNSRILTDEDGNFTNVWYGNRNAFANRTETLQNLSATHNAFKNFDIQNNDFEDVINKAGKGDLIYADPPYANTKAVYNENWTDADDKRLMKALDNAVQRGAKFVLSNVFSHNGNVNNEWIKWAEKYNVKHINRSYHGSTTDEVIVSSENASPMLAQQQSSQQQIRFSKPLDFNEDDEFDLTPAEKRELDKLLKELDDFDANDLNDEDYKPLWEVAEEQQVSPSDAVSFDGTDEAIRWLNDAINPSVKEFFKNSVVKDDLTGSLKDRWKKDGKYLVPMYHGTPNSDMYFFDSKRMGQNGTSRGHGFYLIDNIEYARGYTSANAYGGDGGKVIVAFVNITKPASETQLTITKKQVKDFVRKYIDPTAEFGTLSNYGDVHITPYETILNKFVDGVFEYGGFSDLDIIEQLYREETDLDFDEFHDAITKEWGFDGYLFKNRAEGTIAVAWRSNQIKDINNTAPTNDPDIRYSKNIEEVDADTKEYNEAKSTLEEIESEALNYEEYMVGETDYREAYLSKRFVNKLERRAEKVLDILRQYYDSGSDIDYEDFDYDKVKEIFDNYANDDFISNIQEAIDQIDYSEYPNDEPPAYDNLQELIEYLGELQNNFEDIEEEYEKYNSDIHNSSLYKNADEETRKKIDEIDKNKFIGNLSTWKLFKKLDKYTVDLAYQYMNARNGIGEYPTFEQWKKSKVVVEAQKYLSEHLTDLDDFSQDLLDKVIKESTQTILENKEPAKGEKMLLLVSGMAGAGKSSTGINNYLKEGFVENDNDIFKQVPSLAQYYNDGIGAAVVQGIVSKAQDEITPTLMKKGYNIAIPMVGKSLKAFAKWSSMAKEYKYKTIWRSVSVPEGLSLGAVVLRYLQTGRFVDIQYVHDNYENVENTAKLLYDNNGEFEYGGEQYRIDDIGTTNRSSTNQSAKDGLEKSSGANQKSEGKPKRRGTSLVSDGQNKNGNKPVSKLGGQRLEKPKPPVTFKSIRTTEDVVKQSSAYIENKLGEGYKVHYPDNFNNLASKAFTQINNTKQIKTQAGHLTNVLLDTQITLNNKIVGSLDELLSAKDKTKLTNTLENIIKSAPDTVARSEATLPFEKALDRAVRNVQNAKTLSGRNHIWQNLRNNVHNTYKKYYDLTGNDIAKSGYQPLLNIFNETHWNGRDAYKLGEIREFVETALQQYDEDNIKENFGGLQYSPEIRDALIDLEASLPSKKTIATKAGVKVERDVSLDDNTVQKLIDLGRLVNSQIKNQIVKDASEIRPAVREGIKAIKSMSYSQRKNIVAKMFRAWKRGFAPAYVVLEEMLGSNSTLSRKITYEMQMGFNKKQLYKGGYSDLINKKLKDLEIKKTFDTKTFTISGHKLSADQAINLYISLNTEINKREINKNGVQYYTIESGSERKLSQKFGKGNADALKAELEKVLPKNYRDFGDFLLETINGSVKAEYMEMFEKKFGKYAGRNEIGEIGDKTYWMLFRAYVKSTNVEKDMRNPAGVFSHAKSRVDTQNSVLISGALSSFMSYIDSLGSELYVKPTYRDVISMLNTKSEQGSGGQTVSQVLAEQVGMKDFDYMMTTFADMLGVNKSKSDIFTQAMSTFSVAKLSLNIGTMLKQFASIWTSNIPMYKSVKGVFSNIFKNDAIKAEYRALVDELGGLKYRESAKGVLLSNADSVGQLGEKIAKVGMYGISKVDLFTVSSGVVSLMHIAEDQFGYKIGTEENKNWVKEHWTEFELSQIGNSALSKNALSRGDYGNITKVIFGFLQGANRAAFGSQIHKFNLYLRNRKVDINALREQLKIANDEYKKANDEYKLDPENEEVRENYINAKAAKISLENQIKDYESYQVAGGKAIPVNMACGLITQGLFIAFINELMKHIKGKKDWDEWEMQDIQLWMLNTAKTIGLDWLPFFNATSSALLGSFERGENGNIKVGKGYEVSVPVVEIANNLVDIFNNLKEGKVNWATIVSLVGDMTGIPVSTLYSYAYGTIKIFDPAIAYQMNSVLYGSSLKNSTDTMKKLLDKGDDKNAQKMMNLIMKSYKSGYVSDEVNAELTDLYKDGYNALPKASITEYTNSNGETVKLTAEQITKFQKLYQQSDADVKLLINITDYSRLSSEEKAKSIKKLYDTYYDYAKTKATGVESGSKLSKLLVLTNGNINLAKYIVQMQKVAKIAETKAKTRKELVIQYINKLKGFSKKEKIMLMHLCGYGVSGDSSNMLRSYLIANGANRKDAIAFVS